MKISSSPLSSGLSKMSLALSRSYADPPLIGFVGVLSPSVGSFGLAGY